MIGMIVQVVVYPTTMRSQPRWPLRICVIIEDDIGQ
jgi:hypothetical protein